MIIGVGVDVVDVGRFGFVMERFKDRFKRKVFTEKEVRYCESKRDSMAHYAARFSAKEAFFKALGKKVSGFRDVEVEFCNGRPKIKVKGLAKRFCDKSGVEKIHLSLTHDGGVAISFVIIEGRL